MSYGVRFVGKDPDGIAKAIAVNDDGVLQVELLGSLLVGEVVENPTANTILGRMKSLESKIDTLDDVIDSILAKIIASPATEAKQAALEALVGTLTDTAVNDPTASGTIIALLKGLITQMQGDGASGKSMPVQLYGSNVAIPVDIQYQDLSEPLPVSVVKNPVRTYVFADGAPDYYIGPDATYFPQGTVKSFSASLQHPSALVHSNGKCVIHVKNLFDAEVGIQVIVATAVGGGDRDYAIGSPTPLPRLAVGAKKRFTSDDFPVLAEPFARLVVMVTTTNVTEGTVKIVVEVGD